MSTIGGYKYTRPSGGSTTTDVIVNFVGFPVSGLSNSNALACCMFVYDYTNKMWVPMEQPATT